MTATALEGNSFGDQFVVQPQTVALRPAEHFKHVPGVARGAGGGKTLAGKVACFVEVAPEEACAVVGEAGQVTALFAGRLWQVEKHPGACPFQQPEAHAQRGIGLGLLVDEAVVEAIPLALRHSLVDHPPIPVDGAPHRGHGAVHELF